jgi:hypothetical protein
MLSAAAEVARPHVQQIKRKHWRRVFEHLKQRRSAAPDPNVRSCRHTSFVGSRTGCAESRTSENAQGAAT